MSTGVDIDIPVRGATLAGGLVVPPDARGVVVFAHGSGSSRFSPRNQIVAAGLQSAGFATLLMDLLTEPEGDADARSGAYRFDIPLLAARLCEAVDWLAANPTTATLPVGAFGASTGAAAALIAAARRPARVRAVVSRGGRPDLADAELSAVRAPVLLIVGSDDAQVLELNSLAARELTAHELAIVPGATHLFEEPGALDRVVDLATGWFRTWLR
jgi:putative phosphoribosyl transferase